MVHATRYSSESQELFRSVFGKGTQRRIALSRIEYKAESGPGAKLRTACPSSAMEFGDVDTAALEKYLCEVGPPLLGSTKEAPPLHDIRVT